MRDHDEVDADSRAAQLTERGKKQAQDHEGNRVLADPDAKQPTREPTRDQQR
jgi:hypothetical protein